MNPRIPFLVIALALPGIFSPSAPAEVLSTGEVTGPRPQFTLRDGQPGGCPILWFRGNISGGEVDRLRSLGFNITVTSDPEDLKPGNLLNYQAVVIAYTGSGVISHRRWALQNFVDLGGGLLIHQPNCACSLDYTPIGFGITIGDEFWCSQGWDTGIVVGGHPVTFGLSDEDLPGAFDLVETIGPGYGLLAETLPCPNPPLAAGTSGQGRVVFETGNANPMALDPGSDSYWTQLLDWLCTPGPVSREAASWGEVKASYR